MSYLLLIHGYSGSGIALPCYVNTYIACLVTYWWPWNKNLVSTPIFSDAYLIVFKNYTHVKDQTNGDGTYVGTYAFVYRYWIKQKVTRHAMYLLTKRNTEARSRNHFCRGKAMNISVCVCSRVRERRCVLVAGVRARWRLRACSLTYLACRRMRRIILRSVASLPVLCVLAWSHKHHDFREKRKLIERKICFVIFPTAFICNVSDSKKNSARHCHKCENVFM